MALFRDTHSIDRMPSVSKGENGPGRIHFTDRVWAISEGKRPQNTGWLVFMGWVILRANEWENYSSCFAKGVEIFWNWATAQFLTFYDQSLNSEHMKSFKVHWKSNLPQLLPSRFSPIYVISSRAMSFD